MMRALSFAIAAAAMSAAAPAAMADSTADSLDSKPVHVAVGVEVGTSAIAQVGVSLLGERLVVIGAVGTGLWSGTGFQAYVDAHYRILVGSVVQPYVGVGLRTYRHHYRPASIDELPDTHYGMRGLAGVSWRVGSVPVEVFGQGGPIWDFYKSPSCSLVSGARAVCPHENDHLDWQVGLGARYLF